MGPRPLPSSHVSVDGPSEKVPDAPPHVPLPCCPWCELGAAAPQVSHHTWWRVTSSLPTSHPQASVSRVAGSWVLSVSCEGVAWTHCPASLAPPLVCHLEPPGLWAPAPDTLECVPTQVPAPPEGSGGRSTGPPHGWSHCVPATRPGSPCPSVGGWCGWPALTVWCCPQVLHPAAPGLRRPGAQVLEEPHLRLAHLRGGHQWLFVR